MCVCIIATSEDQNTDFNVQSEDIRVCHHNCRRLPVKFKVIIRIQIYGLWDRLGLCKSSQRQKYKCVGVCVCAYVPMCACVCTRAGMASVFGMCSP